MEQPNTVIIDVRNTYEAVIGRFDPPPGGAEYIDPKMRVSSMILLKKLNFLNGWIRIRIN
jgi:hypothetical protein